MADPRFYTRREPLTLEALARLAEVRLEGGSDPHYRIDDVAPLEKAAAHSLSFLDNPKYIKAFRQSEAGACVIKPKYREEAPAGMQLVLAEDPYRAYARIAQHFYPYVPLRNGISPAAHIDATARIGDHCSIAAGAAIGQDVEIGDHCVIGGNTVIHDGVILQAHTRIGALCSLSHCLLGKGVIIHRGVHIGQDGFGFSMGRDGHVKVPQLGRVLIHDHVEIGAGTCIDRGTGPDTIIGEGTKIDNLVQIAHNVHIGKHCVIAAQTGIAGSSKIGDHAVFGGQVGISGHMRIGAGARLAAQSGVIADVPAGASYGGTPAVPVKDWHRQSVVLARLIRRKEPPEEA